MVKFDLGEETKEQSEHYYLMYAWNTTMKCSFGLGYNGKETYKVDGHLNYDAFRDMFTRVCMEN